MDSFEQNGIVRVHEMQALYNSFQSSINQLNKRIDNQSSEITHLRKINESLKQQLNEMTLINFIKYKIKHIPICK